MHFALDEQQVAIQESARRVLSERLLNRAHPGPDDPPALSFDPTLWAELAVELGWSALLVSEDHHGLGLGWVEAVAVLEETGRTLLRSPFLASSCVATSVLEACPASTATASVLRRLAAGKEIAVCAFGEHGVGTQAMRITSDDAPRLDGEVTHVAFAPAADWVLVKAESVDTEGALFAVPTSAEGVHIAHRPSLDQTHLQGDLRLDGVRLSETLSLSNQVHEAQRTHRLTSLVGIAAEALGGADHTLSMAVEYAKVRQQFGRPIGSFQAIKHKLADMMLLVESARSAVYYAAWALHTDAHDLESAAHIAKAYACRAYFHCAAENIQIHGGIGFTWEHDAHLYFKRAELLRHWWGDEDAQLDAVAHLLEL